MLKVTNIEEIMKVGSTIPLHVTCNDNNQYILKGLNIQVPTGKALFNEIVAARFASLIKLETPKSTIGILPQSVIISSQINLNKYKFKAGPCFLSKYMEGTSLKINPVMVKSIANIEIVPKLILFDTILMNSDRDGNDGNWFILKKNRKLIAIDHSNIFRLAQIWDKVSLEQDETNPPKIISEIGKGSDYRLLIGEYEKRLYNKKQHPHFHQYPFSSIGRKIESLTINQIKSCFVNIPSEWRITKEDKQAAFEFLKFQIDHINDIIQELDHIFEG